MLSSLLFALISPILVLLVLVIDCVVDQLVGYSLSGRSSNPWISGAVYLCIGTMIGAETADVFPHRILTVTPPISGISLLLAPLGAGVLAHFYGSWQRRHARDSSWLATFWGGSLLAFSIAFVRWMAIGRQ